MPFSLMRILQQTSPQPAIARVPHPSTADRAGSRPVFDSGGLLFAAAPPLDVLGCGMPTDLKSDPMPSDLMKEATADADWTVHVEKK